MTNEQEQKMIEAHQAGIRLFEFNPNASIVSVAYDARAMFDMVSEQDSFVAGFIGARRRQKESV